MIVDDSAFMRSVIRDILQKDSDIEVVAEAADGEEALEKLKTIKPDVMTLDLEMPKKNGISVLSELKQSNSNVKTVIVSAYTTENSEITLDCLKMGAVDFLLKPSEKDAVTLDKFTKMLNFKVKAAAEAKKLKDLDAIPKPVHTHTYASVSAASGAVVIGSSTGGPIALEKLLAEFNEDFPWPVLIAQHLPEQFIISLAQRIRDNCSLEIYVAETDMEIKSGAVYFIPGGHDGTLIRSGLGKVRFSIVENTDEILTPSIDKLMLSTVNIYQDKTIGVILTGMGKDGLLGAKEIKAEGGTIIVQDADSSAVFGMGREVVTAGLADFILPLDKIVDKLQGLAK